MGELFQRQRNRAEARKHLRAELLLRPSDPRTLLDLSNLLMDNGQSRAAIACLKRMITLDPANVSGHQNLAVAQFMRGQYADGIATCEEALRRDPASLLTVYNLALAYQTVREYGTGPAGGSTAGWNSTPATRTCNGLEFRLRVLRAVQPIRRAVRKLLFWRS